jgi:hypothetical protein
VLAACGDNLALAHPLALTSLVDTNPDPAIVEVSLVATTTTVDYLPGKRADVIIVDRDRPHLAPGPDPYSTLVYAVRGSDVRTTIVDGALLVDDFEPVRVDRRQIAVDAREAARQLAARANL